MMKYQRTGLTEGTLIYNEWLKTKNLYRKDTEDEFINWLYTISGWFDKDIKGTYFDFDAEKVRQSANYQRFLHDYDHSLLNSDMIHVMLHDDYYLNLKHQDEFATRFVRKPTDNYCYWQDKELLTKLINKLIKKNKKLVVVNHAASLIAELKPSAAELKASAEKYPVIPIDTPQTQLNGTAMPNDYKNSFEVLDEIFNKCVSITPHEIGVFLIAFGAYSCLLADKLNKQGYNTIVLGSGIQKLFPITIPKDKLHLYRPAEYAKIENGKYWI